MALNKVFTIIPRPFHAILFVINLSIHTYTSNLERAHKILKTALTLIATWLSNHSFRTFAIQMKTRHFRKTTFQNLPPPLLWNQKPIPYIELVPLFHSNHSWIHHIRYIKAKSLKMLNVLKCLAHPHTGCKRNRLITQYRTLIRSILDYGPPRSTGGDMLGMNLTKLAGTDLWLNLSQHIDTMDLREKWVKL